MSQAQHVDLAQMPFNGSKILAAFKASRERLRSDQAASRELSRAMADLRRRGGHNLRMPAAPAVPMAQPAFGLVGGQRAFAAASTDRLNVGWSVFNTGINADLEHALGAMRARSRDWSVNSDAGARYLELVADNVIGPDAPRLQMRAKLADGGDTLDEAGNLAVEAAYAAWCQRGMCEITGTLTFGEVCRTVVQTAARDGEYLARSLRGPQFNSHGFTLQLLDVDRIDTGMNRAPAVRGGNAIRLGIEIDAYGRTQALHLHNRHPGDAGAGLAQQGASDRVPADQFFHGFVLKREEQVRGYPWCAAVLMRANKLHVYEGHAIDAAKYGAAKMGFYEIAADAVQTDGLTFDQLKDATGELVQDVEGGMLEALPPGVTFKSHNPDYPHQNFAPFVAEFKRDIAAGLSVAHHNLTGNMTGVNYSSARIAELTERRHWRGVQRWFINSFVRPVFLDWLRMALLSKAVRLPSGAPLPAERFEKFANAATFQSPGWDWVDPDKDLTARAKALTYDMGSLRQFNDENGIDQDELLIEKARLRDRYVALKLPVPAWMSGGAAVLAAGSPTPAPTPAPAPKPAAEETTGEDA